MVGKFVAKVRGAWGLIKAHPVGAAVIGLIFVVLPHEVQPWWGLFSNDPLFPTLAGTLAVITIPITAPTWEWFGHIPTVIGLGLFLLIWRQQRAIHRAREVERVAASAPTITALQMEEAQPSDVLIVQQPNEDPPTIKILMAFRQRMDTLTERLKSSSETSAGLDLTLSMLAEWTEYTTWRFLLSDVLRVFGMRDRAWLIGAASFPQYWGSMSKTEEERKQSALSDAENMSMAVRLIIHDLRSVPDTVGSQT